MKRTCIIGGILGLSVIIHPQNEPLILDKVPITQQTATFEQVEVKEVPKLIIELGTEPETEVWYGKDRKLSAEEWDALAQMIMGEARGESYEVQYYIACTVLNRVDSDLFPNCITGVIYQTKPVTQFYGAWDSEQYEPSSSVLDAIQQALIENRTPEDMFYFTSEGYLPGTDGWQQVGNMWFSRQK